MNKTFAVVLLGVAAGAAYLPACAATISLENRPCPCATGWTCCASQRVCVAEGTSCPDDTGGPDAADGSPRILASTQSPRCMAADQDHLYWQNADGRMIAIEKAGGAPQVAEDGWWGDLSSGGCSIATDGTSVFSSNHGGNSIVRYAYDENGRLAWVPGSAYFLTRAPSSLAVDDAHVYVTSEERGTITKLRKSVFRRGESVNNPIERGDEAIIARELHRPGHLVVDGDYIYWAEGAEELEDNIGSADGGAVTGAVKRMPKAGGEIQVLAAELLAPSSLTVAGNELYFWTRGDVWAVDIEGHAPPRTVAAGKEGSGAGLIASDGQALYFGSREGLRKVATSGDAPGDVMYASPAPNLITVDETLVFWVSGDQVMAADK